jgi:hypothetical protein
VKETEGETYLLRYDEETDEWTLQSGTELVTVDSETEKKAEQETESCGHCHVSREVSGKRG